MEVIIAIGADKIHPGRFKDRTTFTDDENPPLGSFERGTPARHQRMWEKFKREWPWLRESDRAAIEGLVVMRAKLDAEECDAKFFKQYFDALKAFGGTPGERTKMPKKKTADTGEDDDDDGDSYVN
jgi:hypothetical protein